MRGDELRGIRKRLGKTQVEFAALLGTHGNTVARWERGERGISESIARLVKLTVATVGKARRRERR